MSTLHITWYGHSNVMLTEGGVSVLVDPFFEGNPFAPDWKTIPRPDIVAVTHDHGDHMGQAVEIARTTGASVACIAELAGYFAGQGIPSSQIMNCGMGWNVDGTVEEKGVRMTMTPAFHSANLGSPIGYVIEMPGGHTVYHAGDTSLFGDMALIGSRFSLDLAMLPAGGVFTMDGERAAQAAALLKARVAMPMHYATFGVLAKDPGDFLKALPVHAPACRALVAKPCETVDLD